MRYYLTWAWMHRVAVLSSLLIASSQHTRNFGSEARANRVKMGMVQSMAVETFGVVDVEEPKYEVVLKRDGGPVHYEIRRYGKRCVSWY